MTAAALKERLRADLKAAMQSRLSEEVRVLRTLIAALDNAEAVPGRREQGYVSRSFGDPSGEVARRELDTAAIADVLAGEIVARRAAADQYRRGGRAGEAEALLAEIALIERYR